MKYNINRRFILIILFLIFHGFSYNTAFAQVDNPGWVMYSAESVSHEEAQAYYDSVAGTVTASAQTESVLLKGLTSGASIGTMSVSIMSDVSVPPEESEVQALAYGLRNDPKLIYEYVRNNIDYLPYFGVLKGAESTLLDGCGNDFDQALLMVELLRASGYNAWFSYGQMFYTYDQLASWLGVDSSYITTGKVLADGGIPIGLYSNGALVDRVWVRASINGQEYVFDPAFKPYISKSKINIASAMQYSRDDFLAAVSVGANIGGNYVQNINFGNLNNKLSGYAGNLISYIRNNCPNSSVEEVIGGRSIVKQKLTSYPQNIPEQYRFYASWDDIPQQYFTTVRIQHAGIDRAFRSDEICGKRLTMTYTLTDSRPQLRLEGELIATGNSTNSGGRYDMTVSIDHPYASNNGVYADQSAVYSLKSGCTYALVSAFGPTGNRRIQRIQEKLRSRIEEGASNTSESVLGESLNLMGALYFKEIDLEGKIGSAINEVVDTNHHKLGIMAQEESYYIDVKLLGYTIESKHNISSMMLGFQKSEGVIVSAFEHAILEQMMGDSVPGISTVKLFYLNSSQGGKTFYADSGNFSSVRSQLRNYPQALLDNLQQKASIGYVFILPEDGQLGIDNWKGVGYISKYQTEAWMSLGMIINGGYYGGYGSRPAVVNPPSVSQRIDTVSVDASRVPAVPTPKSAEPVDMSSGAFLHDQTDLAFGQGTPEGAAFTPAYNSSLSLDKSALGYGWRHNYDIHIEQASNSEPGLGMRSPVDAAAVIADLFLVSDLMQNRDDALGWTVAALSHKWAVDTLINNSATVVAGSQSLEYIKLPGGTFSSPPGVTTQLLRNADNTFSLKERFGKRMDFNSECFISRIVDVDGNTMNFSYTDGKLILIRDCFGRELNIQYSGDMISSVSDPLGRSVYYSYDSSGNLSSFMDAAGKSWGYGYDSLHRMTSMSDPLGITTVSNVYDSHGRVRDQFVPRQGDELAEYKFYFSGYRNAEEDPYGNLTIYSFDDKGRLYSVENALGAKSVKEFDGQNHTVKITDARGNVTRFSYDGNNNLLSATDALTNVSSNSYDSSFRLTRKVDPLDHEVSFDYDDKNHLLCTTDALGNQTSLSYYANGLVADTQDARGTLSVANYDNWGNLSSRRVGSHAPVSYVYDKIGRLTTLEDNEGAQTSFVYDPRGLLLTSTDPLGGAVTYVYNDAGKMVSRTDRNGSVINYSYTPTGNVSRILYPDSSAVDFTYDLHDKLTRISDPAGATAYTYDAAYRLVSSVDPHGFTVTYEYDTAGNMTRIIYPGDKAVSYTYDALNRVKTVTNWLGESAVYTYDQAGRLAKTVNFNGSYAEYGYDDANRLVSLENMDGSSLISSYSYLLDANGNVIQVSQDEPMDPALSSVTTNFTYNTAKNRLLTAGNTAFSYDSEGRTVAKGAYGYTYDYEHRLKTVGSNRYTYDARGNRIEALRDSIVRRYVYDVNGNLIAEADGSNNILRYYVYGLGLLSMIDSNGSTYCYHFNRGGSTIAVSDSAHTIVNKYSYTPFGVISGEVELVPQPFKYVGKYGVFHEPCGLYYMRARYYDPQTGRFITQDPIGFEGGINLYAYCGNNPVNLVDYFGLCSGEAGLVDMTFSSAFSVAGAALGAKAVVSGLSAGANSVLYAGPGAAALAAASSGTPIFKTAIGSIMNKFESVSGINLPSVVWDIASAIYAAAAKGTVQVFITQSNYQSTFARIEAPIIEFLSKAEMIFK